MSAPQVVYYEGEESVIGNLVVAVADPDGAGVAIAPYEAELIYETSDIPWDEPLPRSTPNRSALMTSG